MTTPRLLTFGCRLNAYESEVMRARAAEAGLADVILVNTCAVTAEAVRQAGQAIRRARRESPGTRIIVTGCGAQTEPDRFAAMPEVDHVLGNAAKLDGQAFKAIAEGSAPRVSVGSLEVASRLALPPINSFATHVRGFVQVQAGCDHACTFCIIPRGRGASRSLASAEVIAQVRHHVESGCSEVVLTGVDITAYGKDLPGAGTLGGLIRRVLAAVPELKRLRLSSLDCVEIDPELMAALAEEERLMPHLHLSLQSGDDMILKRMRRRHSRREAVALCERARSARRDLVLGADLIAGFPTESEDMHRASLALADECSITYLHVFPYSPRPGTPAERMPQVPRAVARERAAELRAHGERRLAQHLEAQRGREVEVLLEGEHHGRTPQFTEVVAATAGVRGSLRRMQVTGSEAGRLNAVVIA